MLPSWKRPIINRLQVKHINQYIGSVDPDEILLNAAFNQGLGVSFIYVVWDNEIPPEDQNNFVRNSARKSHRRTRIICQKRGSAKILTGLSHLFLGMGPGPTELGKLAAF